jgi:hypothetical protein
MKIHCSQDVHDACRCTLEAKFKLASEAVVNAKNWGETRDAMQFTYPIATICIAIDEGFEEELKYLTGNEMKVMAWVEKLREKSRKSAK